jgi:ATP phosphoribosyltransferase regulatory subunit
MSHTPTLLPSGLMDVLPPLAAAEFRAIHHFLKSFTGFGYQPVIPPLAEYEQSLLAGQGEATSHQVFRVADPLSTGMLALRADITGQVARIAENSLSQEKRPLRLCYAGYTLRTAPEALKTRRQYTQVGIERFGDIKTQSVAEILAIASYALTQLAPARKLSIDLHYPAALHGLLSAFPAEQHAALRDAVRMKDTAKLRQLGATTIALLMDSAGDATRALAALQKAGAKEAAELEALVEALTAQKVEARITIDMLDLSGYEYYCGIGFALYWQDPAIEVARGGCYKTSAGEEAVGFTLYIDDLLEHLPVEAAAPVARIAYGTPIAEAVKKQAEGYVTVFE